MTLYLNFFLFYFINFLYYIWSSIRRWIIIRINNEKFDLELEYIFSASSENENEFEYSYGLNCKDYDHPTALLRLKRYLFCEYDPNIRPISSHQIANNVTMQLLPKLMEFVSQWNLCPLNHSKISNLSHPLLFTSSLGWLDQRDGVAQLDDPRELFSLPKQFHSLSILLFIRRTHSFFFF